MQFSYVPIVGVSNCPSEIHSVENSENLPSSGQTLAPTEPEARLYNHQLDRLSVRPTEANVYIGYISAISQRIELKFCMIVI